MTGPLSTGQVRHLLALAADAVGAAIVEGVALGASGLKWRAAVTESAAAHHKLADAIAELASADAPEGASCEKCGSMAVYLHPLGLGPDHPVNVVLCRTCVPEAGAS